MKKLLVFVFVFQFLNNSFSQKIIKSEIDQFTNEKKTKSNMLILGRGMNSSLGVSIRTINSAMILDLAINYPTNAAAITKDNSIMFKFDSGEIVNLNTETSKIHIIQSYLNLPLPVPIDKIDVFLNSKITNVRINTSEGNFDFNNFKEKSQIKVQDLFKLMKQELTR